MRMTRRRSLCVFLLAGIVCAAAACGGSSPASPSTSNRAVVAIEGLTATVEPITAPAAGWLYHLVFRAHETSGTVGAALTATHFALSNGLTADGGFTGPGVLQAPRVAASGTITAEATLSVLTTAPAASHVVFTVSYLDDNQHTNSANAAADISPAP